MATKISLHANILNQPLIAYLLIDSYFCMQRRSEFEAFSRLTIKRSQPPLSTCSANKLQTRLTTIAPPICRNAEWPERPTGVKNLRADHPIEVVSQEGQRHGQPTAAAAANESEITRAEKVKKTLLRAENNEHRET